MENTTLPIKSPVPPSRDVFYKSKFYSLVELEKIKEIYSGKFPIILVNEKSGQEKYALKVFPYSCGLIPSNYHNEVKFIKYKHPNVLEILAGSEEYHSTKNGIRSKACYILMEYAPYKDFHTMMIEKGVIFDDILSRTYFHQLLAGMEFLHQNGVYHLDLKLENLLLGSGFQLKIADFDLSYIKNEGTLVSKGTKDYRPPEIINGTCMDPAAADVYSAGVLLFIFVTNGFLPYTEGKKIKQADLFELLKEQDSRFWTFHCMYQKKNYNELNDDFKSLFFGLVNANPNARLKIEQIKMSKWYNGPILSPDELQHMMEKYYQE